MKCALSEVGSKSSKVKAIFIHQVHSYIIPEPAFTLVSIVGVKMGTGSHTMHLYVKKPTDSQRVQGFINSDISQRKEHKKKVYCSLDNKMLPKDWKDKVGLEMKSMGYKSKTTHGGKTLKEAFGKIELPKTWWFYEYDSNVERVTPVDEF